MNFSIEHFIKIHNHKCLDLRSPPSCLPFLTIRAFITFWYVISNACAIVIIISPAISYRCGETHDSHHTGMSSGYDLNLEWLANRLEIYMYI